MNHRTLLTAAAVLLLAAGTASTFAQGKDGMAFPKDWKTFDHIGSLVVTDKGHGLFGIHHFYINKKGLKAFQKGEKYPDGTVIFDAVYQIVQDGAILNEGKPAFYPVMKKNSRMTDTGGWEWAAFGPDGTNLGKDPKNDCFSCHAPMKDGDYVFSKPLGK